MLRKSFRRGLGLGLLLGAVIAVYRTWEARREIAAPQPQPWTPVSAPPVQTPVSAPPVQTPVSAPPVQPPVAPPPPERVTPEPEPLVRFETPEPETSEPEPEPEVTQPLDEVGEPVPEVPAAAADNDDITPVKKASPRRAARAAKKKAPATKKAAPVVPADPWIDPEGKICPPSHPVKAKLASKIFHVPGGFNYERTVPDRCYQDAGAAEADGLRQSKR